MIEDNHTRLRSPFDLISYEEILLSCSTCHKPVIPWPVGFRYSNGEQLIDRIDPIIQRFIKNHKCALPAPKEDKNQLFKINQWVINTASGNIWQVTEEDVEVLNVGYQNGKRNVIHYL